MDLSEPLLTTEEVAKITHEAVSTVQKKCREKEIKHMRIGKRFLFRAEWIEAYLKSKERLPKRERPF